MPSGDGRGLLLAVFLLLFVLHFDELFGLHTSRALVMGTVPVNYVYHMVQGALHVGFLYLLYRQWPDPPDHVLEADTDG